MKVTRRSCLLPAARRGLLLSTLRFFSDNRDPPARGGFHRHRASQTLLALALERDDDGSMKDFAAVKAVTNRVLIKCVFNYF